MQDRQFPPPRPPEPSASAGFAVNRLDRRSERRDDADWIDALKQAPGARVLVLSGEIPVLKKASEHHAAPFTLDEAAGLGAMREIAFLGLDGDAPLFAALIDARAPEEDLNREDIAMVDLRSIATQDLLPVEMLGAFAQAKSLMHWHATHRFCANCGAPTRLAAAGWRRACDACGKQHFPRTDPVVIMLVVNGGDCLLGRHVGTVRAGYPKGTYSCLAGYVESGETCEDAVRREVFEEAGIKIGRVDYYASQPWPFPATLMIGCIAEAIGRDVQIDPKEIEDARWFSREEAELILTDAHPDGLRCPPKLAIANLLISAWVSGEAR
ncbi:NAD(+) diphosphatase [Methylocapsa acidiphila]|uniref:NAD(+) diphosphatase n=1 Tax=Methylocapsa acidiphila TaxID=133552 RepID=UPI00047A1C10|nr:NAD(+) diphosphatase [Methylocapsa acidiphila]